MVQLGQHRLNRGRPVLCRGSDHQRHSEIWAPGAHETPRGRRYVNGRQGGQARSPGAQGLWPLTWAVIRHQLSVCRWHCWLTLSGHQTHSLRGCVLVHDSYLALLNTHPSLPTDSWITGKESQHQAGKMRCHLHLLHSRTCL